MINWEVNLIEEKRRKRIFLSTTEEDSVMAASVTIGSMDTRLIGQAIERDTEDSIKPTQGYLSIHCAADQISRVLATVNPFLNNETMWERLNTSWTRKIPGLHQVYSRDELWVPYQ